MNEKLPYYLAYPMSDVYDDRMERMDFDYMRSLYPDVPKRILPYVEEECDRMEYKGSMVYDAYPDRLSLRMMSGRIFDRLKRFEKDLFEEDGQEELQESGQGEMCMKWKEAWLRDLTEVMLYQELYRRRSRSRGRKQWLWKE